MNAKLYGCSAQVNFDPMWLNKLLFPEFLSME